jgi:D-alanyl-D-alanine carboxypeptidase (penicillin-binding protein 5/6)
VVLIIKKFFSYFLALSLIFSGHNASALDNLPQVSASSFVLMHDGERLAEKNADLKMPIASTTKLMTAILAIENCSPDEYVDVLPEHCSVEGSSMYLKPGERIQVRNLIEGLLLVSGNDAALCLADHVAGSMAKFVEMMNSKAEELGMQNSHFTNPHGLNDEQHYSTAGDMALLMEYCMDNKSFAEIDAMKSCRNGGAVLLNHNKLIFSCPGCIGGKTGYTKAAGRCLVSCCEREGAKLVCVTLSDPDDWNDHKKLYEWVYSNYSLRGPEKNLSFSVPVISGKKKWAHLVPEKEIEIFLPDSAELSLRAEFPWFVFAPVNKGKSAGTLTVLVDDAETGEYYLVYSDDIGLKN